MTVVLQTAMCNTHFFFFINTGMFMLWWGWLGFNCGSTFGVSGGRWKLASRSAVCTINASCGGGVFATFYSYIKWNR